MRSAAYPPYPSPKRSPPTSPSTYAPARYAASAVQPALKVCTNATLRVYAAREFKCFKTQSQYKMRGKGFDFARVYAHPIRVW
eukprot:1429978-Rhodomonas_salina.3